MKDGKFVLRRAVSLLVALLLLPACGKASSAPPSSGGPPPTISGDFNRVALVGNATQDIGRAGTASFAAAGTYTESTTVNTSGAISAGSDSGTYSVALDRAFSCTNASAVGFGGGVFSGEKVAISSATSAGSNPGIVIDLKKGDGSFSNATLSGTYYNIGFAYHPPGNYHYSISGLLTFDGVGSWSAAMSGNTEGTVSTGWTNTECLRAKTQFFVDPLVIRTPSE